MRQDSLDPRSDVDLDVVERYFSNTLPPADRAEFEQRLNASPVQRRLVEDLRALWNVYASTPDPWNTQVMWHRVVARTGIPWPTALAPDSADATGGNVVGAAMDNAAVRYAADGADVETHSASSSRSATPPGRPGRPALMMRYAQPTIRARRLWSAAIVVLVLFGAGFWSWSATHVRASHATSMVASASHWKSYVAPRGQRTSIQLQDGTKIVLAADSRLRVRQDAAPTRDVELSGEAYFEVHHDGSRPFVVHTAQSIITELGTSFSVRAYPDDPDARVVVTSGRVRLTPIVITGTTARAADTAMALIPSHVHGTTGNPGNNIKPTTGFASAIVLTAGDMANTANGATTVAHNVDTQAYDAWLTGELHFVNTPLKTVVRALERWYDVKVYLEDPNFANYPLQRITLRDGSVDDAMDVVTTALGLRYERRDGAVWILRPTSH